MSDEPPKKRIGRPKKEKLPVGRPKGQEQVMKEYRMRMLNSPKSRKVLDSLFEVAMDTEHKHWPAASKMVIERLAPVATFVDEAAGTTGAQRPQINIQISGLEQPTVNTDEAVDGEFETVDE